MAGSPSPLCPHLPICAPSFTLFQSDQPCLVLEHSTQAPTWVSVLVFLFPKITSLSPLDPYAVIMFMRHPWPLYLKLHPAPSLTHTLHLFSLCLLPRNVVFYIVCLPLWCHTYGCGGHAFLSLYSRAQRPCALHTRCKLRKVMAFYLFCGLRPCCISRALNHAVCVWLC